MHFWLFVRKDFDTKCPEQQPMALMGGVMVAQLLTVVDPSKVFKKISKGIISLLTVIFLPY